MSRLDRARNRKHTPEPDRSPKLILSCKHPEKSEVTLIQNCEKCKMIMFQECLFASLYTRFKINPRSLLNLSPRPARTRV